MINVCKEWHIPYLNLSDIPNPENIAAELSSVKPKILLCSIEDISKAEVQNSLQMVDIQYIAIDECQVSGYILSIFFWYKNHEAQILNIQE